MCLILFAIDAHPDAPLVIASNRDEEYSRPTASLDFWKDAPGLLAGRDLQAGGTWLGFHPSGRWAAVTNVRQGASPGVFPRSRGELVRDFLLAGPDGGAPPQFSGPGPTARAFAARLRQAASQYGGFNLLLGEPGGCLFISNRTGSEPRWLGPGIYGLANGGLDSDWPKVSGGKAALRRVLQAGASPAALLALLRDDSQPPDHLLPDTGIGLERERQLGRRFIVDDHYGTRAATVALATSEGLLQVWEQSFDAGGITAGLVRQTLRLSAGHGVPDQLESAPDRSSPP